MQVDVATCRLLTLRRFERSDVVDATRKLRFYDDKIFDSTDRILPTVAALKAAERLVQPAACRLLP